MALVVVELAALGLAVGFAPAAAPAAADQASHQRGSGPGSVRYQPPVLAPVIDPFRPPLTPYGPGNRGIDYATVPGTSVRAAADGIVVFAGAVAGGLHVTILHGDGVRTTYSFLAVLRVDRGQRVRGGDVVGLSGAMLHLGARRGDVYIDPASLWGTPVGPPMVHLVPLDGHEPAQRSGPGSVPGPERARRRRRTVGWTAGSGARVAAGAARGVGAAFPGGSGGSGGSDALVKPARASLHFAAGPASAEPAITSPVHPRSSMRHPASMYGPEILRTAGKEEPCPRLL